MKKIEAEVDHLGLRTVSETEYWAIKIALERLGMSGAESPAEGHQRTFFNLTKVVDGPRLEIQLWDTPEMRKPGFHIDFRATNPIEVLQATGYGYEDWGEGEIPRGGVRITDNFMIMARPKVK